MTVPAIRVDRVIRDFGAVRALDGLSFEVPRGVVFGFLGPNGAGKTTIIRVLLGLVAPTRGRSEVFGFDSQRAGSYVRERAGALLEHSGVYERLSAEQNLDFFGRAWHMSKRDRAARIKELLSQFGLWERRDDPVGNWSRGMKQKLAVARAVLHRPPLVFLDEPTAGLDPVASASLRDDLSRLALQEGVTIFLTTHNLSEAERLCSLVGVIRKGRLMGFGAPTELRAKLGAPTLHVVGRGFTPAVIEALGTRAGVAEVLREADGVTVTLDAGGEVPPLVTWLVGQGVEIEELRRDRASFEHVFLDLVGAPNEDGPPA